LFVVGIFVMTITAMAQTLRSGNAVLQGFIRSRQVPLPGALVTAVDTAGSRPTTAITEVNGQYILKLPGSGKYHVTVEMTPFTPGSADIEIDDASKPAQKDFDLTLLSQTQLAAARQNTPA